MPRTTRLAPHTCAAATVAAALVLLVAGRAVAGDRFTPPTHVGSSDQIQCRVVNISTVPRQIIIEARNGFGAPFPSTTCFPGSNPFPVFMQPGDVSTLRCNNSGPQYCHFTVVGAGRTAIRGTMEIRDDDTQAVIAVIPAE